jgi:hypothetical protein
MLRHATAIGSITASLLVLAAPAHAGIVCNGSYQIVGGNEIATPYCADNYLAQVARKYGVRVTNSEIRNNPNRKHEVCRLIGHDIRVSDNCNDESPRGGRGGD